MRNAGLIAFGVTTCVLVPAALHQLSAGKEQIAKLASPNEDEIELRGAKIKASLDRYMLDPGEKLTIQLDATDIKGKALEVGVLVLGSNGTEGDRVPSPPNGVAFRTLKIDAKDGAGRATMEVALKGAEQRDWRPFGHYTVLVGDPKALAKLDSLRDRSGYLGGDEDGIPMLNKAGEKFMGFYDGYGIDEKDTDSPYLDGKMARLEAHTRPKSTAFTLAVPDTATALRPFTVSVTMKNPGRRAMKGLQVALTENPNIDIEDYDEKPVRTMITPDQMKIDLGPHETRTVEFTVTPFQAGVIGLYANGRCEVSYDDANACRDVQAFQLGAFDATEINELDVKPPAVVVR